MSSPYRDLLPEPPDIEPGPFQIVFDGRRVVLKRAGVTICTLLQSEARWIARVYWMLEGNYYNSGPGGATSLGTGSNPPDENGMPQ